MIASFPMYERAETAAAHDRYWALIRDALGGDAPSGLRRGGDPWADWHDPGLVLSQTCGLPFRTVLKDSVALVGTPDYGLPDCPPGYYCSVLVTRPGEVRPLSELRLAVNDGLSQSGWAAAVAYAHATGDHLGPVVVTGAHGASARAVARNRADAAFIDAVTWAILLRWETDAHALSVRDRTPATPGLPYVTAVTRDPAPLAAAVRRAAGALLPEDRASLGLRALVDIPASAYHAIPNPPPLPAKTPKLT